MKKILSLTLVLAVICSLFSIVSVSANTTNETQTVLINRGINFEYLDEEFIPFDPVTNAIVYPITYKDRTYIPARFLAEAIGFGVTWDEETQTVGFNDDGSIQKVYEVEHGDRTPYQDTVIVNKNIKFTVNGEPFVPMEADGSICYPLTYKDRTYIPARFIAEKAGLSVTWIGETQTIKLDYAEINEEVEVVVPTTPTTPVEPTTPTEPKPTVPETTDSTFKKASEITKTIVNGANITLNGKTPIVISKLPNIMSFINTSVPVINTVEENVVLNGTTVDFSNDSEIAFVFEATDINALKDYLQKNINAEVYMSRKTNTMAIHLGDGLTLIIDFEPCKITLGTKTTIMDFMLADDN